MSEIQTVAGHPPAAPGSVNATNFQDAPHSAWGFHHVRQLHPTEQVWRGPAVPTPFPEGLKDINGIAFETADGRESNVGQMLASNCTDGFIVLHRGVIIAETYGNGMRPRDPHILMSTTKSFTGTLTGILVTRGVIDVEARVTSLLPALEGTGYDGATIRHLLDMRVGLDYSEDYEDPESDFAFLDAAGGWRPPVRPDGPRTLLDFLRTVRPGPPHGGAFHYVSANSIVLGWALEAATGERFAELLSRWLWQPMEAEFDADVVLDRQSMSQTEGGLNVTLRDLARFGELHRRKGELNGRQVVPASWIEDLRECGDPGAWDRGTMADGLPGHHYRSQWYTYRAHTHRPFFTLGAFGQSVYVDPVAEVVIAKLSCHPNSVDTGRFDDMFRAIRAICDWCKSDKGEN